MTQPKIVFLPGCFDDFDGSQEELDELVAQLQDMVASGELEALAEAVDLDSLSSEERDLIERLENTDPARTLH